MDINNYIRLLKICNDNRDKIVNSIRSIANEYLITNSDYENMNDLSKVLVGLLVNTLDDNIANKFSSKENIIEYVSKMITIIRDNKDVADAMIDLFSIDQSKFSTDELNEVIDGYIKIIADKIGENPVQLKIRLGFDNPDTLYLISGENDD